MVKKWELKIKKRKKEKPVSITKSDLLSPDYPTSSLLPPPYEFPNISYPFNSSLDRWEKIQHRMMSEGRAIAMNKHPRRFFLKLLIGDIGDGLETEYFVFTGTKVKRAISNLEFKEYRVVWPHLVNGLGDPLLVMNVDKNSDNPGGTDREADNIISLDSTFGKRAPDAFVWAAWFYINPLYNPPDEYWPPYADLYPAWNDLDIGPPFPSSS